MLRLLGYSAVLLGGLGLATPAQAGWRIQVPFVDISIGPGVHVQAPLTQITVGRPLQGPGGLPAPLPPQVGPLPPVAPIPAPPQGPALPQIPPPTPLPAPVPLGAPAAMTLGEFAQVFRPIPGTHEVVLIHSRSGRAVPVAFTLPPGIPNKVRVQRHEIEFDYGRQQVTIRCQLGGKIKVSYH